MNRRKRNRRRVAAVLTVLILIGAFSFLRSRLTPMIRELAKTRVSNEASFAINRAIIRQIEDDGIAYDRMILLEKDVQGNVSAIKTNMAEVNRLQTAVLSMVDEEVLELSVAEIGIPLGNILLPEFFSGKGPALPVRILSVSTSDADFSSEFSDAGINQTLHRILLSVSATMTVLTPLGTQNVTAQSQMIVAETVIVGTVPQTYMDIIQ